jgi:hypothetical protein
MSHITTTELDTKIVSREHMISALNMMKEQLKDMTYETSDDGKIIQIHYPTLDDPVKRYHADGNVRFSEMNDGTWIMSGDKWNCKDEYQNFSDTFQVDYLKSGFNEFCSMNNYSPVETIEDNKLVILARKW